MSPPLCSLLDQLLDPELVRLVQRSWIRFVVYRRKASSSPWSLSTSRSAVTRGTRGAGPRGRQHAACRAERRARGRRAQRAVREATGAASRIVALAPPAGRSGLAQRSRRACLGAPWAARAGGRRGSSEHRRVALAGPPRPGPAPGTRRRAVAAAAGPTAHKRIAPSARGVMHVGAVAAPGVRVHVLMSRAAFVVWRVLCAVSTRSRYCARWSVQTRTARFRTMTSPGCVARRRNARSRGRTRASSKSTRSPSTCRGLPRS